METLRRYTNMDKVTLALILEEGRARATDLQFHLTLTRGQIKTALDRLIAQGTVTYEAATSSYKLI
jgi:predicted ArsR family transcriptional regulator